MIWDDKCFRDAIRESQARLGLVPAELLEEKEADFDAGLEQQAGQILEYPYPDCDPDFQKVEEVEAAVSRDVPIRLPEQ